MLRTPKIITVLFAISVILLCSLSSAALNGLSPDDWSRILDEIGITPDPGLPDRLAQSGATLQKIQEQTRGTLKAGNWISIFEKLYLQPKKDMRKDEWVMLFDKIGLAYTPDPLTLAASPTVLSFQEPVPPPPGEEPSVPVSTDAAVQETGAAVAAITMPVPALSPGQVLPGKATTVPPPPNTAGPAIVPSESMGPFRPPFAPPSGAIKISLDLRDADIFSALRLISQRAGMNIVVAGNVRGSVTIYLKDSDPMDAFRMILEMNDLAYIRDGNMYKVMADQDYEKMYGKRFNDKTRVEVIRLAHAKTANIEKVVAPLKSKVGQIIADAGTNSFVIIDTPDTIEHLRSVIGKLDAETETRAFPLSHAKPKDVVDKIRAAASPGPGIVQSDDRTNQIIVTDYPEKIQEISELVASLDRRNREVLIEAKIVQIILNDEFKMGVNWEYVFNRVNDYQVSGKVTGNLNALSAGAAGIRLSVGTLAVDNFTTLYDILQTVGKTNLVSSPKIATIEDQEAKILVGTKEAYVTTTVLTPGTGVSTTAESVTFIDVGVKLFVTPSLGDDNYITMKIRPEVSAVERQLITAQGNAIPIVRTSESETTVMVKDGVTIVIAGLMEDKKEKSVSGIPLLCRIPLLGALFGKTSYNDVKTELAVFLTPHVISGDVSNLSAGERSRLNPQEK